MAQSRRDRIKALFEQALDLPAPERAKFLEDACAGDAELRQELESLLTHAEGAPDYLDRLAADVLPGDRLSIAPADSADPLIGQRIAHYNVLQRLGAGGMGVVYKAMDTRLDRVVALKFLTHPLNIEAEARQRFVREAKTASSLDHPNIGTVYEINETDDGRLYIAMAFYDGETLKETIARGPLSIEDARNYACQMAEGLSKAHAANIIHRDIKPANVIVTSGGVIKIVDFGLAKMSGVDPLTRTGTTMGTAAYMSPEQIRGEEADHRSDLWSLGVILYEMIAGTKPFQQNYESALVYSIVHAEPDDLSLLRKDVPESMVSLVNTLLQKDPALRLSRASDILSALRSDTAETRHLVTPPRVARNPVILTVTGVVLAVFFALFWWVERNGTPKEDGATTPALDMAKIAIMPFDVREEVFSNLREDMVEVIHLAIQNSEEVSSVDPNTMFVYTAGDSMVSKDPVRASAFARSVGAGWYVLGRISQLGDHIQVTPRLYRTSGEGSFDMAMISMQNVDQIRHVADTLAQRVVGTVLDRPDIRIASFASQSTSSPTAFRHFLRGQHFFKEKKYEEAAEAFELALSTDSTFALAAFQYAQNYFYLYQDDVDFQQRLYRQAERHLDRLPVALRWLVQAEVSAFAHGELNKAEPLYRKYLSRYPDDGYALIAFGDFLFHYNPLRGRSVSEAKEYLENGYRIVRSDQDDALLHLGFFAVRENDMQRYLWITTQADSIRGTKDEKGIFHLPLYREMIQSRSEERGPMVDILAQLPDNLLTQDLYLSARDIPGAIRSNVYNPEPTRTHNTLLLEAAAGRFRNADSIRLDRTSDHYDLNLLHRARIASSPWSTHSLDAIKVIRDEVNQWHPEGRPFIRTRVVVYDDPETVKTYLLGILSFRLQDDSTLQVQIDHARSRASRQDEDRTWIAVTQILNVLQSARIGDPDSAIRHFKEGIIPLPSYWYSFDSPLTTQDFSRLVIANLLFDQGRLEDALPWYVSLFDGWDTDALIYAAPVYYQRARTLEELGNPTEAITYYTLFLEFWKDADPGLHPMVADAERRLEYLYQGMTGEAR